MKNIPFILVLAFLVSMIAVSASEIEITSPAPGQRYYVWDNVPITFTHLGEGWEYVTCVNGEETDVFAPDVGGKYVISVVATKNSAIGVEKVEIEETCNVRSLPRPANTQITITSPIWGKEYSVGDVVTIEYETPLAERDDFIFKTYVTGPDGVRNLTEIWAPTVPGEYGIRVDALGIRNGFTFSSSQGFEILPSE